MGAGRRCQVLAEGQHWREAPLASVRAGQVFRLHEADGSPVLASDGATWRFRATSDATAVEGGEARVEAEPVPETDVERAAREGPGWWPGERRGRQSSRLRG